MEADKSPTAPDSMERVKVYRLNDDGKWDDQGTGHVTVDYLEGTEDVGLLVLDEEDSDPLLMHRICYENIYRKQEDTIISWRDPEYATELALSFQESTGCTFIWDRIITAQRNLPNSSPNGKKSKIKSELNELPAVELSTLPLLLEIITEGGQANKMRLIELLSNNQKIFKKLMDLFRIYEEVDNRDVLHMIYKIVKGIILLNSTQIFEKIFGDDLLMDIIGSLEYDPDVKSGQHYRSFLEDHVVFKEALPINDPVVLSTIHQTYIIGYLKDIILPKVLDEATVSSLNSIIHSNNTMVVSLLKDDNDFIQELFAKIKSSTTSAESKKELVFFLYEFCSFSKSLQVVEQRRFFRDLTNEGIFYAIAVALQSEDKRVVLKGADVLIVFLNQDPNLLSNYIIQQEGNLLLGLTVKGLITDFGEDMNCQFLEIVRILLETYTLPATQRDVIVEMFYEKHLSQLVDIIKSSCPSGGSKPEILSNICDLLCYCVMHHPYRIKCNFLLNGVVEGVLFLTQRREMYLVVSAVRFVRTILSHHDEHLIYQFINNNILKPVVEAFVANGNRYNLLHSAVLDLFEYIRKENLQLLLVYVVEFFWNRLVRFENLECIHSFKIKYDQISEDIDTRTESNKVDKAVEKNFSGNSDADEKQPIHHIKQARMSPVNGGIVSHPLTSTKSAGLVDYEDGEDDEEGQPPSKKDSKAFKGDGGVVESSKSKRKLLDMAESELLKKQHCEELKPEDSAAAPMDSIISQAEVLNKETLDPAKSFSYSSAANERSYSERRCHEETSSDMSCSSNKMEAVGCGNSDSETINGKPALPDQLEKNGSFLNDNPDEEEDPSIKISSHTLSEETREKEVLSVSNGQSLDNRSSKIVDMQGMEPDDQKDCPVDMQSKGE